MNIFDFLEGQKAQALKWMCKEYPPLNLVKAELIYYKALGLTFEEIQKTVTSTVNIKTYQNYIREFNLLVGNVGVRKTSLLKFISLK